MPLMMASVRSVLLASLTFASAVFAQQAPQATELLFDSRQQFKELLEALPEESLHSALHLHPNFRDGIYPKYRSAVEAVHQDNPPLATRLLAVAALDLIKRQNGTSPPPTSTTSQNNPPPSSNTQVVVPVVVSTTDSAGSAVVVTTSAVASASVSVAVAVTTTNAQGQQVVTSSTVAGAVVVSNGLTTTSPVPVYTPQPRPTGNQGVDITTTDSLGNSVVLSNVHSGQAVTTTDAQGSTFVTSYTPGAGAVSSLFLSTTTLPNGSRSTITSFAVVQPTTSTGSAGHSGSSNPHLQSGATAPIALSKVAIAMVGAAVGAAFML